MWHPHLVLPSLFVLILLTWLVALPLLQRAKLAAPVLSTLTQQVRTPLFQPLRCAVAVVVSRVILTKTAAVEMSASSSTMGRRRCFHLQPVARDGWSGIILPVSG